MTAENQMTAILWVLTLLWRGLTGVNFDYDYLVVVSGFGGSVSALRPRYQVPADDPEVPWYYGPLVRLLEWWFG